MVTAILQNIAEQLRVSKQEFVFWVALKWMEDCRQRSKMS